MAAIVKINNLAQITYRTDLFTQGENSYHVRRNPVVEHVIFNKGTPEQSETDYEVLISTYTKHKDIQAKLPDGTIHPFEIGYGTGTASATRSPIVVDKIILMGDFTLGGMNFSRLSFEKPAIGVSSLYTAGRELDFIILNELTQNQDGYMHVTGTEYTSESGYVTVTNKATDCEIWCDTWEIRTGQTSYKMNRIQRAQSQINVSSLFTPNLYDKDGDVALDNGGYYTGSTLVSYYSDATSLDEMMRVWFSGYSNSPELQNKIATMFEYGGIHFTCTDINLNSSQRGNINHSYIGAKKSEGSTWVSYQGYLSHIIIPFINATERDAAKAVSKYWTRQERAAFDEIYGE